METMIDLNQCNDDRESANESAFKSASAPTSPTSQSRQMGALTRGHPKGHQRVSFPDDNSIVTGYFEAPNPYQYVIESESLESLMDSYQSACDKQNIRPIPRVLQQLKKFNCNRMRGQDLILRGERLDSRQCEALEEILKRVLFRMIDLDSCDLDCEGATALFDMIEFYESASHLCIANNKSIGVLGWQSLCRTLKKTSCLQYLDLQNTGLNEQILLIMGRAMRLGSHLVTIHLENAGLYGRRLAILVAALKLNTNLRELYLGDNKICSADGVQIGNLLRANACLDILDLRKNHIQDIGLDHICEGLAHQPYGGLKILNLNDNQLSSRAMNHLSQSLTMCRSLTGLDLSNNSVCNDGISVLKEGLLLCKSLKYLNLSATNMTCEGAIAMAEVIADNQKISIVDLSDNNIRTAGLMAICHSMKHNTSVVDFKVSQNIEFIEERKSGDNVQTFDALLQELNSYCALNKSTAIFDESFEFIKSYIDYSLKDSDPEDDELDHLFTDQILFSTQQNESSSDNGSESVASLRINEMRPDVISNAINGSHSQTFSKPDIISIQENLTHGYHKPIARTVSLGSWQPSCDTGHKQSGRFSVSPVNLDINESESIPQSDKSPVNDVQTEEQIIDNSNQENDSNSANKEPNSETSDQLMDLPTKISKAFLTPESPYNKNIRRMSSPNLSQNVKPKPKPLNQIKQFGSNLESLDLKSSLPISPTFFARFEFPDPILLRLPPEVDEIIAKFVD